MTGSPHRVRASCLAACLLPWVLAGVPLPGGAEDADLSESALDDASPPEFDPFAGIGRNGSIPSVDKPDGLPNPGRWRYIPEGRLKPGNIFERFLVSTMIAPFIFRDGDVGLGGGLAFIDIDFRQTRRREFAGIFLSYSEEGQQNYSMAWRRWLHHRELPEGGVLVEERSFVRADAGYSRTLTRRFFGLGPGTERSDESDYSDEEFFLALGLERALPEPGGDWVASVGVRGELHRLSRGRVSGEPDTRDAFPELFEEARDHDLGWLEAGLRWDTRDSPTNPYRGWVIGAKADAALAQSGGDVGTIFTVGASKVLPVPGIFHRGGDPDEENPPTDTLAARLRTQLSAGELPFFARPTLGGSRSHRGFIDGRWRDDASWTAGIEHRIWVIPRGIPLTRRIRVERLGIAGFYEAGAVAGDAGRLFRARVRHSYGVGFRATLERQAPFRVDLGFSEDGLNVSAGFGLPF